MNDKFAIMPIYSFQKGIGEQYAVIRYPYGTIAIVCSFNVNERGCIVRTIKCPNDFISDEEILEEVRLERIARRILKRKD